MTNIGCILQGNKMKKRNLIAAALLAVSATFAFAQSNTASNVEIYGVMDASIQHNETTGGTKDYTSNAQLRSNGSLIGFKGVENIGGGNSVAFQYETGINTLGNERGLTSANNGTGFGTLRDTYVSVNTNYGAVAGGYMSTPYRSALVSMEIFPGAGIDLTPSTRATGIRYTLPTNKYNVTGSVAYSGDNSPTAASAITGTNRIVSGNTGWAAGNVRVVSAFQQTNFVGTVYPVKQATNVIIGGQYFGLAPGLTVSAIYGANKFNAVNGGEGTNDTVWLGAAYRTGPHEVRGSWARNSDIEGLKGAEDSKASQLTAGYAYHMSKRTQLYAMYTNARTGSQNAYNFTNSPVASITTLYALGDATYLQAYGVGIRHSF
jgi:predicted porin